MERQIPCGGIYRITQRNYNKLKENSMKENKTKQKSIKEENKKPCCCTEKQKKRSEKEYSDLMNRLKRIEGQVRGIQGMLEKDAYCIDILTQVSAINAALNSFNKVLLANHMESCVAENIRNGNDEVIEELVKVLPKLMK